MLVYQLEQYLLDKVSKYGNIRFMPDHYLTYEHENGLVVKNLLNTKVYLFRRIYSKLYRDPSDTDTELYETILRIRRALNEYYNTSIIEEQYY